MATSTQEWIDELKSISVLELAERIKALEEEFGVSATAVAAAAPAAAGAGAGADGDGAAEEQSTFDVVLTGAGDKKIQVIKVVRAITNLGLKEAKDLVDGAPNPVKEGVPREEADQICGVRILEQPRTTVARVQVAGDGEQPWAKVSVGTKTLRMRHEPQPGLFKQVFGDVAPTRQPREKGVQAAIEGSMHDIKRLGIARSEAADELELKLSVHRSYNAEGVRT